MRFSLKSQVLLFLAAAVVILGTALLVTYYSLSVVDVASKDYQSLSQDLYLLTQLQINVQKALMPPNDYLIQPDPKKRELFDDYSARAERFLNDLVELHRARAAMPGTRTAEEHRDYMRRDIAAFSEVRRELSELNSLAHQILSTPPQAVGDTENWKLMERMDATGDRITDRLQEIIDYHSKEMRAAWASIEAANAKAKRILLIKVVVASLLALVLIGLVIAHANMLKQSITRRNQLNNLYQSGRHLTSLLERDQLNHWIANTAAKLMRSEAAGFHLLDGGRLIVGNRSLGADKSLYQEIPLDRASPWRKIINSNEPHLSANIAADPLWPEAFRTVVSKAGFSAFLGVPLRVKDQAIGVLTVFRRRPGDFQSGEIEVFGAFADQAAVALENVRLIENLKSTQHQLLQTEKMASIGQFIAGMAHEVGTPLNIISGNAEYLKELIGEEEDVNEELTVIIQQTERITRLIQQLLNFSRPQQAIEKRPLQINTLINQVISLIGHQAAKDDIEISTAFQADMPSIIGSEELLQQAFLNISLNAFHAMPKGGRLTIITQTGSREIGMDAEPEWVEAIFRDNGVGIKPEDLKKVFDPFFSTKPSGEGTGLGLYLSYQIVNNHQGEIQVESDLDKGTTVRIMLPISADEEEGHA